MKMKKIVLNLAFLLGVLYLTSFAAANGEEYYAPCLVEQFKSIPEKGGKPITFSYRTDSGFIGNDPTNATHYQGVTRVQGPDGTPYFILTRNGNPKASGDDFPGEILVVRMGSQIGHDNEIGPGYCDSGDCQPQDGDVVIKSYLLNGAYFGPDVDWKHPGSGQLVGDLLFIPVEKTCNYSESEGKCVGDEEERGAILILDVSDPENITLKNQIEYVYYNELLGIGIPLPMIGTLAVTKEDDGYLLAGFGGSYNKEEAVTFYRLSDVNDLTLDILYVWNADDLWYLYTNPLTGEEQWGQNDYYWRCGRDCAALTLNYQMMNFVRDSNGDLYLIGTDNDTATLAEGWDFARLFKVVQDEDEFVLTYIAERHLYLTKNPKDLGDLDAAAGIYVSPSGQLILYTAEHDNDGPKIDDCSGDSRCNVLDMGEFASNYFSPPLLSPPPDQCASEGHLTLFNLGEFDDKGGNPPLPFPPLEFSWQMEVNWGDGTTEFLELGLSDLNNPIQLGHAYPDGPLTYTVEVCIIDECGFYDSGMFNIDVNNVPPAAGIDSVEQPNPHFILPLVHMLNFNGSFTDPGWLDTHTSVWDFGDGTIDTGDLTEENDPPDATGTVTVQYTYSEPGTYSATLTVTDNGGGAGVDTTTITVISPEDALEILADYINDLPSSAFGKKHVKQKTVLVKKIHALNLSSKAKSSQGAAMKLKNDIRAKSDGYVDGRPKNDWINDPQAQYDICLMIDDLIAYLRRTGFSRQNNRISNRARRRR